MSNVQGPKEVSGKHAFLMVIFTIQFSPKPSWLSSCHNRPSSTCEGTLRCIWEADAIIDLMQHSAAHCSQSRASISGLGKKIEFLKLQIVNSTLRLRVLRKGGCWDASERTPARLSGFGTWEEASSFLSLSSS